MFDWKKDAYKSGEDAYGKYVISLPISMLHIFSRCELILCIYVHHCSKADGK